MAMLVSIRLTCVASYHPKESKGDMFHSLLPKLPSLYQSLQKYLKAVLAGYNYTATSADYHSIAMYGRSIMINEPCMSFKLRGWT